MILSDLQQVKAVYFHVFFVGDCSSRDTLASHTQLMTEVLLVLHVPLERANLLTVLVDMSEGTLADVRVHAAGSM